MWKHMEAVDNMEAILSFSMPAAADFITIRPCGHLGFDTLILC